jgi:Holliday junction resolvase
MPNKNYIKGRRKEYKVMHEEKAKGCIAFRTAGSHSPIDVVSINPDKRTITLIQCKPDTWTEKQILFLLQTNELLNGRYDARFIVK